MLVVFFFSSSFLFISVGLEVLGEQIIFSIFSVDLYMHKIYNNMYCYISEVSHLIAIINSVMASICRQARINPFQLQIICRLLETKVEIKLQTKLKSLPSDFKSEFCAG